VLQRKDIDGRGWGEEENSENFEIGYGAKQTEGAENPGGAVEQKDAEEGEGEGRAIGFGEVAVRGGEAAEAEEAHGNAGDFLEDERD